MFNMVAFLYYYSVANFLISNSVSSFGRLMNIKTNPSSSFSRSPIALPDFVFHLVKRHFAVSGQLYLIPFNSQTTLR